MSSRGRGSPSTDRLCFAPLRKWNAISFSTSAKNSAVLLTISYFLFLFALTICSATAYAKDSPTSESGLFALSLEEALEIDVTAADHFVPARDGVFSLTSHELLRLYAQADQLNVTNVNVTSGDTSPSSEGASSSTLVPVLFRGEYVGSFHDVRSAIRVIQTVSNKDLRVDLYIGARTIWYERGEHQIIFDVRDGVDLAVAGNGSSSDSSGEEPALPPVKTEVLP